MDALNRLLADLDAKIAAGSKGPWDTGEGCSGPYLMFQDHAPCGGYDGFEVLWLGGDVTESDRKKIVASVNAAPLLSRIARAAAEYRKASKRVDAAEADHHNGHDCDCVSAWDDCDAALDALFAALDAAEAEAANG